MYVIRNSSHQTVEHTRYELLPVHKLFDSLNDNYFIFIFHSHRLHDIAAFEKIKLIKKDVSSYRVKLFTDVYVTVKTAKLMQLGVAPIVGCHANAL